MPASHTQSLLQPIIVMILFVVLSLVQKSMAKKKKQGTQIPQPQQREDYESEPPVSHEPKQSERRPDLGRTLDDILGDLGIPVPQEEPQQHEEKEEQSLETEAEPEVPAPSQKEIPAPKPVYTMQTSSPTKNEIAATVFAANEAAIYTLPPSSIQSSTDIYDNAPKKGTAPIDFTEVSASDIQRFVVWNEILSKPKSLRQSDEVEL